jgi:hypothetical protein
MNATDLRAWQARHGYTYNTAAEALGMGRTTFAEYLKREGQLPRWLALACAAVDAGLLPVGDSASASAA